MLIIENFATLSLPARSIYLALNRLTLYVMTMAKANKFANTKEALEVKRKGKGKLEKRKRANNNIGI